MNLKERNQKVRNFFNEEIDNYDDVHSSFMNTKKELADSLDKTAKRVLDLGAGTGLELFHLFELFKDIKVTVIDISEKMLDKLKEREFSKNVETICGDFFEVEFGNNYDAVISTSALHHFKIEEKEKLYKKIYNSLKDNGQFINCDYTAPTEEVEKEQLYELEHNINDFRHIDTPITEEHEIEILRKVGFKEITVKDADKENYKLIIASK